MTISAEPLIYGLIFPRGPCDRRGNLSDCLWQIDQPEQPCEPPSRDARKRRSDANRFSNSCAKRCRQHMNSKGMPIYSLLAAKAQKANIAFSPPN